MKKLTVAVVMLKDYLPPDTIEGLPDKVIAPLKTEYDVLVTLRDMGHQAHAVGLYDDLGELRSALREIKPDVVFNLLEEFHGFNLYMPFVLGYLELLRQPYTGCNPYALMLTHNKGQVKKILKYHRVRTPEFTVFQWGRAIRRPKRLGFPLLVKSATEHGSVGIAQSSVVYDDKQLVERVSFVFEQMETDALAEEYIDGRELYVGVIGNRRLQTLPVWELNFKNLPDDAPRIATEKVKWDLKYQKSAGITSGPAKDLDDRTTQRIARVCKRVYRILGQSGYARMDLRLTREGKIYVIEPNPNPQLEYGEDFAESAHVAGIDYERLLQRIMNLGLSYRPD